jgi:hypothetical protein
MPIRIELYDSGSLVEGVEEWWDDIELALESSARDYPLLESISPYGDVTMTPTSLERLVDECQRLADEASGAPLKRLLLEISELGQKAIASEDGALRFNGD